MLSAKFPTNMYKIMPLILGMYLIAGLYLIIINHTECLINGNYLNNNVFYIWEVNEFPRPR